MKIGSQRTHENWVPTKDPLALGSGQASLSATSGLTQHIGRAAQVSGLTTWRAGLAMCLGQGSCSATWRVCLTQRKGRQPKCQVSPRGGAGLADAESSPTKTWIYRFLFIQCQMHLSEKATSPLPRYPCNSLWKELGCHYIVSIYNALSLVK